MLLSPCVKVIRLADSEVLAVAASQPAYSDLECLPYVDMQLQHSPFDLHEEVMETRDAAHLSTRLSDCDSHEFVRV